MPFVCFSNLISGHNMASAQIRHFYNTPTTISSTKTRQLLQQQQHTNNCSSNNNSSKRKQFQSDTFLGHTQKHRESGAATGAASAGATLCQQTIEAGATPPGAAAAASTGGTAAAADDVQECCTTDEITASLETQPRMQHPLASSAAVRHVAATPAEQQQQQLQQHQCTSAAPAAGVATSAGTSERDCYATSTSCLSRLSSKASLSQDSTKPHQKEQPQRKLLRHDATTRDSDASTSTNPAVSILMDMQKFARSIFPLVIIFNLLPLFYAGKSYI